MPVSPDGPAPGEQSIAANAVYLAGPKRIQGTPFWTEAVEVLRQRFAKHHVIVAGDGTFRRYNPVPIRELKALVLIVPLDGLVGFGSYVETSNALRFKRPTWVYVNGELRSGFALHINDAESFSLFGRVEPAIDGTVSVERYAKSPSRQPASQAAETIARQKRAPREGSARLKSAALSGRRQAGANGDSRTGVPAASESSNRASRRVPRVRLRVRSTLLALSRARRHADRSRRRIAVYVCSLIRRRDRNAYPARREWPLLDSRASRSQALS